jgi:hypothetical protein
MEYVPAEHIAIFGASVLLLVVCYSDREQRVHISVVAALIVAFGVMLSTTRRVVTLPTPCPPCAQPQMEPPQMENFEPEEGDECDRHCIPRAYANPSRMDFGRFVSGHPRVTSAGKGVHRKGYHLFHGGSC